MKLGPFRVPYDYENWEILPYQLWQTHLVQNHHASFFACTNDERSNMQLSHQLPAPKQFAISFLKVTANLDAINDISRVMLRIGCKYYGEWFPRSFLTMPKDVVPRMALFSIFCKPDFPWNASIPLEEGIIIPPQVFFEVAVYVFSNTPRPVTVSLEGKMLRPVV